MKLRLFVFFGILVIVAFILTRDRLSLMGGLLQVDVKKRSVKLASADYAGRTEYRLYEGRRANVKGKRFILRFQNGKIHFAQSPDGSLSWKCNLSKKDQPVETDEKTSLTFDLNHTKSIQCGFRIPASLSALDVIGENGEIEILRPKYPVDLRLRNGEIALTPVKELPYLYDINVRNGRSDRFLNAKSGKVIRISIDLENGVVRNVPALAE